MTKMFYHFDCLKKLASFVQCYKKNAAQISKTTLRDILK